jgi:hypothetical protein
VALGIVTFSATREAHALGPVDIEVGAKAGLATNPETGGGSNPMGFGLGARGGVDFLGFYGGVAFMYYFGSSQSASAEGQSFTESVHTVTYGVEAGYGISLFGLLTLRPQVGIGNATFSSSVSGSGAVNADLSGGSKSNLYIEPGVTGLVAFGGYFVGADANLLFLPGLDNSKTAFTLHGQIGLKF